MPDSSSTPEYSREYLFDSLTLYLTPDGSFCGDTLKSMALTVSRLTEEVELNDESELYAHSEFGHEDTPLSSLTFMPKPLHGRPVELRLDDGLGDHVHPRQFGPNSESGRQIPFFHR